MCVCVCVCVTVTDSSRRERLSAHLVGNSNNTTRFLVFTSAHVQLVTSMRTT